MSSNNRQSQWSTFDVRVTRYKEFKSNNNLIGYAEVAIDQLNVEIRNIGVFNNKGTLSIALPKVPISQGPKPTYYPMFVFYDSRDQKLFEKKVVEALLTYFKEQHMNPLDPDSGILLI